MADIVERLRVYATDDHERGCDGRYYACACGYDDKRDPLLVEAADEIERLRDWNSEIALNAREFAAENERLRAALWEIVSLDDEPKCCGKGIAGYDSPPECCGDPERGIDRAQSVARAALEGRDA